MMQAKTEIDILMKIQEKDPLDERHVVRLLDQFVHRNHQCIVFEILSFNLYELLRNTRFRGVSLNLIRKFAIQLLRALELLSRPDVNIIHCDLKPENLLLRHPKRSAIKMIDFGSSCYQNKRTYTYIQSRFYRSPEVLLGLPYSQKIDMWSLGCVVVELHTGEPLFGGANQVDQICRIVDVLGMPPLEMIQASPDKVRTLFFEKIKPGEESTLPAVCDTDCTVLDPTENVLYVLKRPNKDLPKSRKLDEIIGVYTSGPNGRRMGEPNHNQARYLEFLDFVEYVLF
jgi:dual specificity tyrosine-phosphorylation-regulated kinase 1